MISTYLDIGGAARSAHRLHRAVLDLGGDSELFVQRGNAADPTILGPTGGRLGRLFSMLRPRLDRLPLLAYPKREQMYWGTGWMRRSIARRIEAHFPDIVHLHWVAGGFFPMTELLAFRMPILWTLHDSWPFTGGCHLPGDCLRFQDNCGACPQLRSDKQTDLSRRGWEAKAEVYRKLRLTVVAPSRWMAGLAATSSLLRGKRIEIIPNGIDTHFFTPMAKIKARESLGLPLDRIIVAFGAMHATRDPNKGYRYLREALNRLADPKRARQYMGLVMGDSATGESSRAGVPIRFAGRIKNDHEMVAYYSAADAAVVPSTIENLPNAVMEAMACGTPCIAFNVGGIPDLIIHTENGYLAQAQNADDLARGIRFVTDDNTRHAKLSRSARETIERSFDIRDIARRYLGLYEALSTND